MMEMNILVVVANFWLWLWRTFGCGCDELLVVVLANFWLWLWQTLFFTLKIWKASLQLICFSCNKFLNFYYARFIMIFLDGVINLFNLSCAQSAV